MKIIKYTKLKNNKYKLFLDNNDTITLQDDVILKNNLLLTKEINNVDKLLKDNAYFEAYNKSLKYITRKIRVEKEIIDYLKKDFDRDVINYVIDKLKKNNYLNDELYVKSYVHDQVYLTNNGYYKILRDLKNLEIDEELIISYLNEIENNVWLDKIDKIISKKVKANNKYSSNYLKEKILCDLNNLGYEKNNILEVLSNYNFKDNEDILNKTYDSLFTKLSKKYEGKELKLQLLNKLMSKGFNYGEVKKLLDRNF